MHTKALYVPALAASTLAGCASTAVVDDGGPLDRCDVTDCVSQRDIRDFDVVSNDTMVIYVGPQRCPFVVKLDGLSCDLSFTPRVVFVESVLGRIDQAQVAGSNQICSTSRNLYVYTGLMDPALGGAGIDPISGRPRSGVGNSRSPIGGGVLEGAIRVDPTSRDFCRVDTIHSITDDQLVELFANEGALPPPPPIGAGELEVPPATNDASEGEVAPANDASEDLGEVEPVPAGDPPAAQD